MSHPLKWSSLVACCVFRPANTCLRMCSHGWKHLKISKKSTFFIMHTRGSRWKTHFWMFLIVFDPANACASMRSLVEIHNSRHQKTLVYLHFTFDTQRWFLFFCLVDLFMFFHFQLWYYTRHAICTIKIRINNSFGCSNKLAWNFSWSQ